MNKSSLLRHLLVACAWMCAGTALAERTVTYLQPPTPPMPRLNLGHHVGPVRSCAFIDGGETLVTAGEDKTIRLWEPRTLELKKTIYTNTIIDARRTLHGRYFCLAAHPSKRIIAVAGAVGNTNSMVRIIDLDKDTQLDYQEDGNSHINNIAFSADGRWLLAGTGDSKILVWQIHLDKPRGQVMELRSTYTSEARVHFIRFPKEGNSFLYKPENRNSCLASIDANTGQIRKIREYPIKGFSILSNDGSKVFGRSNRNYLCVFDRETGQAIRRLPNHLQRGHAALATFTPDGSKLYISRDTTLCRADWLSAVGEDMHEICDKTYDMRCADNGLIALVGGKPAAIYVIDSKTDQTIAYHEFKNSLRTLGISQENPLKFAWGFGGYYDYSGGMMSGFDFASMQVAPPFGRLADYTTRYTRHEDKFLSLRNWKQLHLNDGQVRDRGTVLSYSFTQSGKIVFSGWNELGLLEPDDLTTPLADPLFGAYFPVCAIWSVLGSHELPIIASGGEEGILQIWHEKAGKLLVNLYVDEQGEWVCWTPLGFYDCSANGARYLDWISEHGVDSLARTYDRDAAMKAFHAPEVVRKVIQSQTLDTQVIEELGIDIPKPEGGARVHKLPFTLTGKGLPKR